MDKPKTQSTNHICEPRLVTNSCKNIIRKGSGPPQFSQMGQRLSEPVITQVMTRALADPDAFCSWFTDNSWLPKALVGKAAARLTSDTPDPETLQYGTNQGRQPSQSNLSLGEQSRRGRCYEVSPRAGFLHKAQQALYLRCKSFVILGM